MSYRLFVGAVCTGEGQECQQGNHDRLHADEMRLETCREPESNTTVYRDYKETTVSYIQTTSSPRLTLFLLLLSDVQLQQVKS